MASALSVDNSASPSVPLTVDPGKPVELRKCTKCGLSFPKADFPKKSGLCVECKRGADREWYRRNRDAHISRVDAWRKANPDKDRQYKRTYEAKPETKEKRKVWQKRYESKLRSVRNINRRRRRRYLVQQLMWTADLPMAVIRPYVQRLLKEFQKPPEGLGRLQPNEGARALAEAVGVDQKTIRIILEGRRKSVSVETADRLSLYADFSLPELTERAIEWAALTGDKWPVGYEHKRNATNTKS